MLSQASSVLSNENFLRTPATSSNDRRPSIEMVSETVSSTNPEGLRASRLAYTQKSNRESNKLTRWAFLQASRVLFISYIRSRVNSIDSNQTRGDCFYGSDIFENLDEPFKRTQMLLNYAMRKDKASKFHKKTELECFHEMDIKIQRDLEGSEDLFTIDETRFTSLLANFLANPDLHKVLRRLYVRKYISEKQWETIFPRDKRKLDIFAWPIEVIMLVVKAELFHEQNMLTTSREQKQSWKTIALDAGKNGNRNIIDKETTQISALQQISALLIQISEIQIIENKFLRLINGNEMVIEYYKECLESFKRCLDEMIICPISNEIIESVSKTLENIDWNSSSTEFIIEEISEQLFSSQIEVIGGKKEFWELEWDAWRNFEISQNEIIQIEQMRRANVSSDLTILSEKMPELNEFNIKSTTTGGSKMRKNITQIETS